MTEISMTTHLAPSLILARALITSAAAGRRIPCTAPDGDQLWLSDDVDDRDLAASCCIGCPVLTECAAAADHIGERFGVWGGTDRTKIPRSLRRDLAAVS